jgi:hypothetical protein
MWSITITIRSRLRRFFLPLRNAFALVQRGMFAYLLEERISSTLDIGASA